MSASRATEVGLASAPGDVEAAAGRLESTALLRASGLSVEFRSGGEWVRVVDGLDLEVAPGETVGIVGESGSGKTVTSMALMGLIGDLGGRIASGSVWFDGRDVASLSPAEWSALRGSDVSMIFQQPGRSLNPALRVGNQIAETVRRHWRVGKREAWDRAVEMLDLVHIPGARERARDYPHQFSGGQCQRIMIAMALACDPKLLIADEPTTALDVTVQAKVLELLREIRERTGIAIVLISHDLGVIGATCDRIVVMYAGQVVETASSRDLLTRPQHPYTAGLMSSIPRVGGGDRRLTSIPGSVPSFRALPSGCRFHPRCEHAVAGRCTDVTPLLTGDERGGTNRCVRSGEIDLGGASRR